MKRSKRLLSLLLAVAILLTTVVSTSIVSVFAATIDNSALCSEYYATNPNAQVGKQATITIDGSFSDWSSDMLIAQGAAWDVANHYKGGHENCVLDTYALYGAWDSQNLYIAWQMVNTTDTWARSGDGPLSDGGRVLDVPLILALRVDPSKTPMSNKNNQGGPIWGQKMGLTFETPVDHLLYMSGKPGLGEPAIFTAVDAQGNTDYSKGCKLFKSAGIEYKMAEGNICSSIMGLNYSEDPADVTDSAADWVDYKTFKGSSGTHDTKYDSFYEIKIPLSVLGIDANWITNNGIGAMLVATRGESALDCIPFDTTMLDNVSDSYGSDPSTSHEKDDEDVITVSLASIGKVADGTVVPTTPKPTDAPVVTEAPTTTKPTEAPTTAKPTQAPVVTTAPIDGADKTDVPVTTDAPEVTTAPKVTEATTPSVPVILPPDFSETTDAPEKTTAENTTTGNIDSTTIPVIKPPAAGDEVVLGDADLNEALNIKDATLIQKYLAKLEKLGDKAQFAADADQNETLNIKDVTTIQKHLAKIKVDTPVGDKVAYGEAEIPVPTIAPTTAAPVTVAPTTAAPATEAPATAAPTTLAPATEAPATAAPTTDAPATEAPATEAPVVTEAPVYTEPVYTEPVYTEPQPDNNTITIYFENTYGWSSVSWHAWNADGGFNTWPGEPMQNVGGNTYMATIDASATGIVFNDGQQEGAKTDDIVIEGDNKIYSNGYWSDYNGGNYDDGGYDDGGYDNPTPGSGRTVYFSNNQGWSSVSAYCWNDGGGNNGEWPGQSMTLVGQNEFGEDIYSYEVSSEYTKIIFTDGGSQTVDIDLSVYTQNGFYPDGQADGKWNVGNYDYVG